MTPPSIRKLSVSFYSPLFAAFLFPGGLFGAPVGLNPGFEEDLTGWTSADVTVETGFAFEGTKCLNLANGFIEQTFSELVVGQVHTVRLAYLAQAGTGDLADARVKIDGVQIGEIHNGQADKYLSANGFEFVPGATTAVLRIESLESGSAGLLVDNVRIEVGGLPLPPEESWADLTPVADARGGRALVNGGFESPIGDPTGNPNIAGEFNELLSGDALPGWRVTRENVDVIQFNQANAPEGTNVLDVGGSGPGGIAQTITGLIPGGAYTVSFLHARHIGWYNGNMTGEVLANRQVVTSLVRTISQKWSDGYSLVEVPVLAGPDGKLTLEVRSTTPDLGSSIVFDDLRISEGGDFFGKWADEYGATASLAANDDGDAFSNGMEFMLRLNPMIWDEGPVMVLENGVRSLRVPVSGRALAQGFVLRLECSRDLSDWEVAGVSGSGATLESDSSAPGVDGERVYRFQAGENRLFWRHALTSS